MLALTSWCGALACMYLCSAKTGHCVERTFCNIAVDLVGIPLEVVQKEWEEGHVDSAGKGVDLDLQVDGPGLDILTRRGGGTNTRWGSHLRPHEDNSVICGCVPRWRWVMTVWWRSCCHCPAKGFSPVTSSWTDGQVRVGSAQVGPKSCSGMVGPVEEDG